jgi:hypothetical protein
MRIPKDVRKCVVYVGIETVGRCLPLGTGVLVAVEHDGANFNLLITARHVIDDIPGATFSVRINTNAGDSKSIQLSKDHMFVHADSAIDLAVFGISLSHENYDSDCCR